MKITTTVLFILTIETVKCMLAQSFDEDKLWKDKGNIRLSIITMTGCAMTIGDIRMTIENDKLTMK